MGAFYPTDAYGARMTGMLEQSLAGQNMVLHKASYDPADVSSWSTAVAPADPRHPGRGQQHARAPDRL